MLYPAIDERNFMQTPGFNQSIGELLNMQLKPSTKILTSLNRYERKKNINLAIKAFAQYVRDNAVDDAVLVVAGGYDPRLLENVEHHIELVSLAKSLNVSQKVVFLRSISND